MNHFNLKHFLSFLALLLFSASSWAQGYLSLAGKIIDKNTKSPISGAYIGIFSKGTGTITNPEGSFVFRFPKITVDSNLVVAVLGYKTFSQKASSFAANQKDIVIELDPAQPQIVGEGFIKAFEAGLFVRESLTKIKKNYPQTPFLLAGFYQETLQQNGDYIKVSEALVRTEKDLRPKAVVAEKVKVLRARSFDGLNRSKKLAGYEFPNGAAIVTHSIESGIPEYLSGGSIGNYKFELDDSLLYYFDKSVYQVRFSPFDSYTTAARSGKIFINSTDSAIVRIEYEFFPKHIVDIFESDKSAFNKKKRVGKRLFAAVNYKPFNKKWYLQDSEMLLETQFEDVLGGIHLHFVTNEILKSNGNLIPEGDIMISTDDFPRQTVAKYDELLWGSFNFILPTNAIRRIKDSLQP